jgi:hypothetical protein
MPNTFLLIFTYEFRLFNKLILLGFILNQSGGGIKLLEIENYVIASLLVLSNSGIRDIDSDLKFYTE